MRYFRHLPNPARAVALIGSAGLLVLLLFLSAGLVGDFFEYNRQVQELEPRIARLLGYSASVEVLRESSSTMEAQLTQLAYTSSDDVATTGARVQQQLRGLADNVGLSVMGSQLLKPKTHEGLEEIRIDLKISGSTEALEALVVEVQNTRPLLLIRSIELAPARTRRTSRRSNQNENSEQVITGSLSISAVRLL